MKHPKSKGGLMKRKGFCRCPKCGECGLEHLKTYAHCVSCLHFYDLRDGWL